MRLIKKEKSKIKKYNFINYESVYKSFRWEDYYRELTFFRKKKLNAAFNAVDRHITTQRKNKIALYFEGADGAKQKYTFLELSMLSNKTANFLWKRKR